MAGLMLLILLAGNAWGHALQPGRLDLSPDGQGHVEVVWTAPGRWPAAAPLLLGCASEQPPRAVAGGAWQWALRCAPGQTLSVRHNPATPLAVVRTHHPDGRISSATLSAGQPRLELSAGSSPWRSLLRYLQAGMAHIAGGFDHLLFVLGLCLITPAGRLLVAVTAFTLGHSITLAAAALSPWTVAPALVEPGIAASLLLMASAIERRRLWRHSQLLGLGFGLLHGLGFAGALDAIGLPPADVLPALLGFNLGVEAGQLLAIAALLLGLRLGGVGRLQLPARATAVTATAVGSLAVFWLLERATALG